MSSPFDFSFGGSNPSQDQLVQKQFPAYEFKGSEASALWSEIREVSGVLWLVVNATFAAQTMGWNQVNAAIGSSAMSITSAGLVTFYTAAAGVSNPFNWTASGLSWTGGNITMKALTATSASVSGSVSATGAVTPGNGTVTGAAGFYSGTGAPTFSAPNGSLYSRYDGTGAGSTVLYVNTSGASTSGTTWTAVTIP